MVARGWLVRLAFLGFALAMPVLLLAVFELGARWYFRDVLSTSHGRDYFYQKNHELFRAEKNGFGLRGAPIRAKDARTYRVVVLGDSLTWGQGSIPTAAVFLKWPKCCSVSAIQGRISR